MSLAMSPANVARNVARKCHFVSDPRKTIIQTKKQYTRTAFGDGIFKESKGQKKSITKEDFFI